MDLEDLWDQEDPSCRVFQVLLSLPGDPGPLSLLAVHWVQATQVSLCPLEDHQALEVHVSQEVHLPRLYPSDLPDQESLELPWVQACHSYQEDQSSP